jgi:hypothetical protein
MYFALYICNIMINPIPQREYLISSNGMENPGFKRILRVNFPGFSLWKDHPFHWTLNTWTLLHQTVHALNTKSLIESISYTQLYVCRNGFTVDLSKKNLQ